jgi:hypothetical protein
MREAARQDREAAQRGEARGRGRDGAPSPADSGASSREREQIAGALDELADHLAGADGQDEAGRQLAEELSRIRRQREGLASLDRQLSAMRDAAGSPPTGGRQGQESGPGSPGRGGANETAPWESVRGLLDDLKRQDPASVPADADTFNPGRSAPGTEAWKQDFAKWDDLKVQISVALERAERTLADRVRGGQAHDRLNTGASQRVPEAYRHLVERYFRSLATGSDGR